MEKVIITKIDEKDSGMVIIGFNTPDGFNPQECTTNMKWGANDVAFLRTVGIGGSAKIETKINGQYCNLSKVDLNSGKKADTPQAPQAMPITESEKIANVDANMKTMARIVEKQGLMSPKEIGIHAHAMNKCYYYGNVAKSNEEVYDRYQAFVKILEENG